MSNEWDNNMFGSGPFDPFEFEDDVHPAEEERKFEKESLKLKTKSETVKVVCSQCGCTIVEYDKDGKFEGVDICGKCFIEYIDQLVKANKNKKLNIYED